MTAGSGPTAAAPLTEERVREIFREELRAQAPPPADDEAMISAPAAAELAGGMHVVTLNRKLKAGEFPPPDARVGEYRRWKRSTVKAWIARQAVATLPRRRYGVAAPGYDHRAREAAKKKKARR